jgi:hypothetical protein
MASAMLFALVPSLAFSQAAAHNLDELRLKVKVGDTIFVTDQSGREQPGRIIDLSPTALVLALNGGRRELPESGIVRIRKRQPDPLWTGGLVGAAIGAGFGVAAAAFSDECVLYGDRADACIGPVLYMTGIGTGIGIGIDALIQGRKVIYEAPKLTLRVSPLTSPGRLGVSLSVQFPARP